MSQKQNMNLKTDGNEITKIREEVEKNSLMNKNKKGKLEDNFIIGMIKIEDYYEKYTIINSYENAKKSDEFLKGIKYEEEIKNCEIFINDKKIDFTYNFDFKKVGIYKIKYVFKNLLNSTNFMFYNCKSLISLDLSNFNTQNVTNMSYMFFDCNSLLSLDLSNFRTKNVKDMHSIFYDCNS